MGTRADFYVGRGLEAEWLGSIAWDGYPDGIPESVKQATDELVYRAAVSTFFVGRNDVTLPERGWPWPWDDSRTTDYAYALDDGQTWVSCFGSTWWLATEEQAEEEDDGGRKSAVFPDMKTRQNVTFGKRSGVLLVGLNGIIDAE